MSLQIVQQWNLLFQLVESLTTHGLLASIGRIRRIEVQSQARMVGDAEALQPVACQTFAASRVPNCSRRPAHRRTVDGSGDRDASATFGTDRSQLLFDCRNSSHALCLQWRLKDPDGGDQSGSTVNVFWHGRQSPRRIQICPCHSSCACLSRRPWPMIVRLPQKGHSRGSSLRGISVTPAGSCLPLQAVR